MKRLLILTLAFILTGCAGAAPASPTVVASSTPQVVIQTVIVTVIPTEQPTQTPTSTPIPTLTPQIIVVTATGGVTQSPAATGTTQQSAAPQAAVGASPSATLPANAGGDIFTDLTRSADHFALDKQGNFTLDFPSSRVAADLRSHRAWFDYQFVGTNKVGDAVGRSAKISKQITYTIDCSD